MLKKWIVGNFKSISKPIELEMAPLTLLVGPNSSGKSTVIQSILLVAQTVASRRTDPQLLLNGEFVRLGSFEDLLHTKKEPDRNRIARNPYLTVGFELEYVPGQQWPPFPSEYQPTKVRVITKFARQRSYSDRQGDHHPSVSRFDMNVEFLTMEEEEGEHPHASSCSLRLTKRNEITGALAKLLEDKKLARDNLLFRPYMHGDYSGAQADGTFHGPVTRALRSGYHLPTRRQMANLVPAGVQFYHFLPNRLVSYYNAREITLRNSMDRLLRFLRLPSKDIPAEEILGQEVGTFVQDYLERTNRPLIPYSGLVEWLGQLRLAERRKLYYEMSNLSDEWCEEQISRLEPEISVTTTPMPAPFDDAINWITSFFSKSIKYLGPLREEPRAIYALPPSGDPADIGLKGEYTAAVLNANKNVVVAYWNPHLGKVVHEPLNKAVECWLQHFRLADSVETQEAGKLGHVLTIGELGIPKKLDLTNVGFGVSQVLPILVMALLANEGSTLIYEQPEIHLHPKLQAEIADFFIGLISCNKRCIVETHSEYLVNRIRRRLAEAQDEKLLSKIGILFSQREELESKFRSISINKYGAVLEWPQDFFDQAQSEAQTIIEAAMRKRRVFPSE